MTKLILRNTYINWLEEHRDKPLIKVLTGMRRTGKSTILRLFAESLKKGGVGNRQLVFINFEELENESLLDSRKLYAYLKSRLIKGKTVYYFLDEIQKVERFEEVLDSLYVKVGVDIYVTGSAADMFSSEIATLLTGRYVEINVLPFSFGEAQLARGVSARTDERRHFMDYLTYGALPESFSYAKGSAEQREYVESVYRTILEKDLLRRKTDGGRQLVDSIIRYMVSTIGSLVSAKRIADRLSAGGTKVSPNTVTAYLELLTDSFMFYRADRFDVIGGEHLKLVNKYYLNDFGFKYYILNNPTIELQQLIENVVFLELKRRRYKIATGRVRDKEVDFVVQDPLGGMKYVQVATTIATEDKLTQELAPLKMIKDNYPKWILTLDDFYTENHAGIRTLNIVDFFTGRCDIQ